MELLEKAQEIKNQIAKYRSVEIIAKCIEFLNRSDATDVQQMKIYPPWLLLLLVKWSFVYGLKYEGLAAQPLTERDFNQLVNSFHELSDHVRLPSEYINVFLFLRNMAFQQFWLQEQLPILGVARQMFLFGSLPSSHPFQRDFHDLTKVPIKVFLELSIVTLAAFFVSKHVTISDSWFSPLVTKYGEKTVKDFLNSISRTTEQIQEYLKQHAPLQSLHYEFYDQTPLKSYPLLKEEEQFHCYFPNLLAASFNSFVYDILRNKNPANFMDKFGAIFEKYVGQVMSSSDITYLTEKQIQGFLGQTTKSVDYLILEVAGSMFIDAKGVEISRIGKVTHLPNIVSDKSESSIIKAIEQSYELAAKLPVGTKIEDHVIISESRYLIVVTYSEFYVGNGEDFYSHIDHQRIDEIVANSGGQRFIPYEHMYFLSIEDFEFLLEYIRQSKRALSDILEQAVQRDKNPQTRKLTFGQHLDSEMDKANYQLPLIIDPLTSLLDDFRKAMQ